MIITQCATINNIKATFSTMQQLRPKLTDETDYVKLILSLKETEKYHLAAMFDINNKCLVVAGYRIKRSLASSGHKQLHVDDLVTNNNFRSQGYGKKMFNWLKEECKKNDCSHLVLDSGVQRTEAHKFYYREKMETTALHFMWEVQIIGDISKK
jgi:hypothetical protein